jgi:catechol 2,3-dioxygenase-like lactoylglutathione lyase family enzyme
VLVPELTVASPGEAAKFLENLGFSAGHGLWQLGSQALRLVAGTGRGHGRIDHIALSVPDMDRAVASLAAKGVTLADVTPNGPELIPEFWDGGLRFVYLAGPEGARIELCARVGGAAQEPGHDHIGIPCGDLAAMLGFFEGQGARLTASVDLHRPEGVIPVRFLACHGGMVELFQPPRADRAASGHWSRLLIQGLAGPVQGPEGLTLAPL